MTGLLSALLLVGSVARGQAASQACLTPQLAFGGANGTPVTVTQSIVVNDNVVIGDLLLAINITHSWVGDIHMEMTSPMGTTVVLQSDDGGNANDIDLTYANAGIPYGSQPFNFGGYMQPAGDGGTSFSDFVGENGMGTWTLAITDNYPSADDGVLQSLCLSLFTSTAAVPVPVQDLAGNPTADGSVLTWALGSTYDAIDVSVNGVLAATLPGTATSYILSGFPAGVPVNVGVEGVFTGGVPTGPVSMSIIPLGSLPQPRSERVVLIIIDGLRYSDGMGDPTRFNVPNMSALAEQGTLIEPFLNDNITHTSRAIPAIECGSWDAPIQFLDPACNENNQYSARPTFHEYYRQQLDRPAVDAQYALGPFCPWRGSFDPSYGPSYWPIWFTGGSGTYHDNANWAAAQQIMQNDHPRLMTIYLPDVDKRGHQGVFANYIAAIQNADQIVGSCWSFLQSDPFYAGRTTMIVTNDHGRHWYNFQGHGDSCYGCQTIEFLAIGPGVRSGFVSTQQRTIIDIAPTIGALLGFETEYADGNVMTEILADCQTDIGYGGPGNATVSVCGGDLSTGTNATIRLVGGPPSSTVYALATFAIEPLAIANGTLIDPTPDFLMAFPTTPAGTFVAPGLSGGGGPASVYLQIAYVDSMLVPVPPYVGFSNAVQIDFLP